MLIACMVTCSTSRLAIARLQVWVRGQGVTEIGSSGVSSDQKAHYRKRSNCINDFAKIFQGMPLIAARHKVDKAANFLFWK